MEVLFLFHFRVRSSNSSAYHWIIEVFIQIYSRCCYGYICGPYSSVCESFCPQLGVSQDVEINNCDMGWVFWLLRICPQRTPPLYLTPSSVF